MSPDSEQVKKATVSGYQHSDSATSGSVTGSVEKVGVEPHPKRVGPASWNLEHG